MTTPDNHAKNQAAAQVAGIIEMLAAVNCDYSRLEELKEELESVCESESEENIFLAWVTSQSANPEAIFHNSANEYLELKSESGECEGEEEAREAIQNDPLSVQVRSDWENVGDDFTASEFMILLCTGGPAVRIVGELSGHGEPCRAWLEYQDWGTPWTRFYDVESDVLVEYASNFYFQS